jgi:hypothetical protein
MANPVTLHAELPPVFRREQLFLRLALAVLIGWVIHPFGLLWLGVPAVAAILLSKKDGQRYVDEDGPTVVRWLTWVLGVVAYLALVTDRLPGRDDPVVQFEVERSGTPTVGSTLLRILLAIPSAIVLAVLVALGAVVWICAAVVILIDERYPESLWRFLLGIVRWEANLLAYLASLTDRYPSFTLETGSPRAASSAQ